MNNFTQLENCFKNQYTVQHWCFLKLDIYNTHHHSTSRIYQNGLHISNIQEMWSVLYYNVVWYNSVTMTTHCQ